MTVSLTDFTGPDITVSADAVRFTPERMPSREEVYR